MLSLILCFSISTEHSLNHCPDFWVHYKQPNDREGISGNKIEARESRDDTGRLGSIEVTTETPNAEVVDKVAQIKELALKINDTDPIDSLDSNYKTKILCV